MFSQHIWRHVFFDRGICFVMWKMPLFRPASYFMWQTGLKKNIDIQTFADATFHRWKYILALVCPSCIEIGVIIQHLPIHMRQMEEILPAIQMFPKCSLNEIIDKEYVLSLSPFEESLIESYKKIRDGKIDQFEFPNDDAHLSKKTSIIKKSMQCCAENYKRKIHLAAHDKTKKEIKYVVASKISTTRKQKMRAQHKKYENRMRNQKQKIKKQSNKFYNKYGNKFKKNMR